MFDPTTDWLAGQFLRVLHVSLLASVLALLIFAVESVLRHKLPSRCRYWLWLLLVARLLLPWEFVSNLSIYNLLPDPGALVAMAGRTAPAGGGNLANPPAAKPLPMIKNESPAAQMRPLSQGKLLPKYASPSAVSNPRTFLFWSWAHDLLGILALVWAAGALALAGCVLVQSLLMSSLIGRRRMVTDQAVLDLLEDCREAIGIRLHLPVIESPRVKSPALFGLVRPCLILPEGMIGSFGLGELRHIFMHELAHLKRHDIAVNWLATLGLILHWFNPLFWLAFGRMRADRELACDALALSTTTGEGDSGEYGRTMVRLLEQFSQPRPLPGMAGILENKSQLKERMTMIAGFKPNAYRWSALALVLVALLSCMTLTKNKERHDKIDYPFVSDPQAIGVWKSVDFVKMPGDFVPGQQATGDLFLLGAQVHSDGFVDYSSTNGPSQKITFKWTKGLFLNPFDRTACHYEIKELNGKQYLFMEWKTGDYVVRHAKPSFYVLEKTKGEEAAKALPPGIHKQPAPADFTRHLDKLPVYKPDSESPWKVDLRSTDLSQIDLAGRLQDLTFADFDSQTKWPAHLPEGFDPKQIMEIGRNPGLGLRALHQKGITGKGVGLAIIDQNLLVDHAEYKDRLRHYEEIHWPDDNRASMHGAAVASIAVGKTVGVAPDADLYYIAEMHGERGASGNDFIWDFKWLAQSINRVLEINRSLPAEKKIRVISISVGWQPSQKGYAQVMESVWRAKKEGVFIISSSLSETFGLRFHALGRPPLSDPEQAQSYEPGLWWQKQFFAHPAMTLPENTLLVPMDSRCTASPTGVQDYVFYREGGWSWSIPYLAGLYALGCQVKPDLTPELFWQTALETGAVNQIQKDGKTYRLGRIAQPERLLEKLAALK